MTLVRDKNPRKSLKWVTRHHIDTFAVWLRKKFIGDASVDEQLQWLAGDHLSQSCNIKGTR